MEISPEKGKFVTIAGSGWHRAILNISSAFYDFYTNGKFVRLVSRKSITL